MMYLLTEQEHAQVVDALIFEIGGEPCGGQEALAMLKAMKPVGPCGWTNASWLSNPHAGHFSAKNTNCFNVPLYAKEQQ